MPGQGLHAFVATPIGTPTDLNTMLGYYLSTFGTSVGKTAGSASTPPTVSALCDASTASYSALGEFGFTPICLGFVAAFQSAIQLVQTAHSRIWIGISSINGSTLQTDNPSLAGGDFVGFRYSTHASDVNFKAVCSSALTAT